MTGLMWFRNDLRVADNTALNALSTAGPLRALFIATPQQWRAQDMAPIQCQFIEQNLLSLRDQLAGFGIALDVITVADFAALPAALLAYCQRHRIGRIGFNREYPVNEKRRDAAVEQLLARHGIIVSAFDDQCIVPPGRLRNGSGQPYMVFTPFAKAWRGLVAQQPVGLSPNPARQPPAETSAGTIDLQAGTCPAIAWQAGEQAAQKMLKDFIARAIGQYREQRDFPALQGTSSLSPYLALGVLSPRQCYVAAMRAMQGATPAQKESIGTWINELIWREFYIHVMDAFPRVCRHRAFRVDTEQVKWRDDEAGFTAWCEGRTGIPIVDAAMRQLQQTGWMHNRLRMVAAMFLTKNLLIDWRRGEQFFMRHLIDGFFPANNGGWQWSASTGTDAAPYFRVFNPVTQGQRFDPHGVFVRHYIPELAHLDAKRIHQPQQDLFAAPDYPAPIVDLTSSRERAIAAFAALK